MCTHHPYDDGVTITIKIAAGMVTIKDGESLYNLGELINAFKDIQEQKFHCDDDDEKFMRLYRQRVPKPRYATLINPVPESTNRVVLKMMDKLEDWLDSPPPSPRGGRKTQDKIRNHKIQETNMIKTCLNTIDEIAEWNSEGGVFPNDDD
uniref:Uncharacterized protein n=1 Tax=Marseillevirus LCMAC202 TaxID=2506606 RepID=A0A481YX93_9VIRU|nr:MAG: hypothetical protein LCMAC202_01880 [Marseillevirus LCMAC202]